MPEGHYHLIVQVGRQGTGRFNNLPIGTQVVKGGAKLGVEYLGVEFISTLSILLSQWHLSELVIILVTA